jgi:hypothetical protein
MNLLTNLDLNIGELMDRVFKPRRDFQPVDLARMLRKTAIRNERKTLTTTFVPDAYQIQICQEDAEMIEPVKEEILADLNQAMALFVAQQPVEVLGEVQISLTPAPDLSYGRVRVLARFKGEIQDA